MRTYNEVEETRVDIDYKLTSVTCNKCGVSEDRNVGDFSDDGYDDNFASFRTHFGYGSRYDNERWQFDLCEGCLTELVKTFAVVPEGFGQDSYFATYPQVMFDKWKETGELDLEAGMTAEEIEENGGSIYEPFSEDE